MFFSKRSRSEDLKEDSEAQRATEKPNGYVTNAGDETARPASPTPSELEELNKSWIPKGWYKVRRYQISLVTLIILAVGVIVFAVYHRKIEEGLLPFARWMKSQKAGWLIPIALMFIVSFPPLFGHEIIGVLTGDVYGLGVGFAIVAAGTLLGEIANYFAFKYWCTTRARRYQNRNMYLACLARALLEGGFVLASVVRYSVIPSHFTTAVFATCGMSFWIYLASAIVSLPKQLALVAVGVLLASSGQDSSLSSPSRKVSIVMLVISTLITIVSLRYIHKKINAQKLYVIRDWKAKGLL